ncbi:stage II sporulation protein E [Pontibacter harenae]|uniref:stage II sporulation protein E n=1 Tax=Pontibacter harenae TaxID=2894083 RepID=UPI001E2E98F0|nr:stage II sporulation protein E [Pontibacter harenae]MCC9166380.1 stage II sporulation protein E [Pontibacter harenae]
MDVNQHQRFTVPDRSFASIAKRDITRTAESFGLSPSEVGKVNIVATEMISNLTKHTAKGGELLVRPLGKPTIGIELICLDNGPGMEDLPRMMEDGVSTAGTAGEGLGAIKRQSDVFDIFSQPEIGTIILSRIYKTHKAPTLANTNHMFENGCIIVPKPGEAFCGDGFAIIEKGYDLYLLAMDGLGHGVHAHEAAQQAVDVFCNNTESDPANMLRTIHNSIRRSRGAVGFMAFINGKAQRIGYCGIGNIAGKLYTIEGGSASSSYKNIISYNGILGHNIPTSLNNQQLDWGRNKLLVMHSDGLKSRWDLSKYPGLHRHHASIIAAVLYKDNTRQTDDTLVMVCKAKIQ